MSKIEKRYQELPKIIAQKNEEKTKVSEEIYNLLKNPPNPFAKINALQQKVKQLEEELAQLNQEFKELELQLDK